MTTTRAAARALLLAVLALAVMIMHAQPAGACTDPGAMPSTTSSALTAMSDAAPPDIAVPMVGMADAAAPGAASGRAGAPQPPAAPAHSAHPSMCQATQPTQHTITGNHLAKAIAAVDITTEPTGSPEAHPPHRWQPPPEPRSSLGIWRI